MFLSRSSLVSLWMITKKWPFEHAIFIDYLFQVSSQLKTSMFLLHNNFFTISFHFHWFNKKKLLGKSTWAYWSCHWRHSWMCWCSSGVSV
jgi:hypothetical protein